MANETKADPNLEKDLKAALTPDQIRELCINAAERSGFVARDEQGRFISPSGKEKAADTTRAAASEPAVFEHTEIIGGRELRFQAASQEELNQLVLNAHRVAAALRGTPQETESDAAAEEAARQKQEYEQNQLETDFRAGRVDLKTYLEQSGAMREYLENQGIQVDQLREQAQKVEGEAYIQSWADATQEFLQGPGADWPGGERNKAVLHNTLMAMDLIDADDKVGAMVAAFARMKELGTIFPNEEVASAEQVQKQILKTASEMNPQDLMTLWKESQMDNSGNAEKANSTLIDLFRRR